MAIVHCPLGREVIEHLNLMRVRAHIEMADRHARGRCAATVFREESIEVLSVLVRVVRGESGIVPVRLEGGLEFVHEAWGCEMRYAHVPFQAVNECCTAHI